MHRVKINQLNLWQFNILKDRKDVKHFVTDRVAREDLTEFTLSYSSSPDKVKIRSNRNLLASTLGVPSEKLYFPSQVHKTQIVRIAPSTSREDLLETDGLITNEKGICIAVLAADCVPIILYDIKNKAVGAVHSGWRGTVAKILEKTLMEMHINFGTRGTDLIACIGPSVCLDSYEVGADVAGQFLEIYGSDQGLITPLKDNKAKVDLWKANLLQLLSFGVPESRIEISNLCTLKNNQHFFSARKGDQGRFASGIMIV